MWIFLLVKIHLYQIRQQRLLFMMEKHIIVILIMKIIDVQLMDTLLIVKN